MPAISKIGWLGVVSAAGMLIGAFGPWAKALFVSVSGTDGSNDGWLVVVAGLAGGLLMLQVALRESRRASLGACIAGVVGAAVTIYDRNNLTSAAEDEEFGALLQIGWGLNLAMIASIGLAAAGLAGALNIRGVSWPSPRRRSDPDAQAPDAASPQDSSGERQPLDLP
jgi:hypothetical protein